MTTAVLNRTIARVTDKRWLGPDAQVDAKALLIEPGSDPTTTDPFLSLVEDEFSTKGFTWHPHRGIETVTFVVDGELEHGDSVGNSGTLQAGDVQWMTAGRGVVHRELAYRDDYAHILQLWVNLPAADKLVETRYQDLLVGMRPILEAPGVTFDVISGSFAGADGPARNHVDVQAVAVTIEPSTHFTYSMPAAHRGFVHVLAGSTWVGGRLLTTGQTAWSDPIPYSSVEETSNLAVITTDDDESVRLMFVSGTPLWEPVVFGGPFVMNRESEITQAYRDFRSGVFGELPNTARIRYDR